MTDVTLIAILLAFFALAIGLVRVLGRMIEGTATPASSPTRRRTPVRPPTRPAARASSSGWWLGVTMLILGPIGERIVG